MSEYYRDLRTSRNDFLQRLSWPVIQLVLAFLIISLVIVIQGFLGPENPGPNDLVFDASGLGLRGMSGLMIFWAFILIVLGTMGVIAYGIWKNWFQAHRLLVPIAIKIPVIGTVLATTALSRLSMTLAMLLNAGVEAKRCLREAFSKHRQSLLPGWTTGCGSTDRQRIFLCGGLRCIASPTERLRPFDRGGRTQWYRDRFLGTPSPRLQR